MPECSSPISFILLAHVRPFHSWSGSHSRRPSRLCSFLGHSDGNTHLLYDRSRGRPLSVSRRRRAICEKLREGERSSPAASCGDRWPFGDANPASLLSPIRPTSTCAFLISADRVCSPHSRHIYHVGRPTDFLRRSASSGKNRLRRDAVFRHVCPPSARAPQRES